MLSAIITYNVVLAQFESSENPDSAIPIPNTATSTCVISEQKLPYFVLGRKIWLCNCKYFYSKQIWLHIVVVLICITIISR